MDGPKKRPQLSFGPRLPRPKVSLCARFRVLARPPAERRREALKACECQRRPRDRLSLSPIRLSVFRSSSPSVRPSVRLSVSLSVCPPVRLPARVSWIRNNSISVIFRRGAKSLPPPPPSIGRPPIEGSSVTDRSLARARALISIKRRPNSSTRLKVERVERDHTHSSPFSQLGSARPG